MSLLDKVLAENGVTRADFGKTSRLGKMFRTTGVRESDELLRIAGLHRRDWRKGITGSPDEMAMLLTNAFKREGGEQVLRPVQAAALTELHDFGGALVVAVVGGGKTLISFLAPSIVEAKRPLLLVPAKLKGKTEREHFSLQKHWKLPTFRMESYELLDRVQSEHLLMNHKPDLIIADECFGYETKVLTDVGLVPIGDIVELGAGTKVLSGEGQWRAIVRRMKRDGYRYMVKVRHERGEFVCTPEHKIWTQRGYVEAQALTNLDHLRAGDVRSQDKRSCVARVEALEDKLSERHCTNHRGTYSTYDLEVEVDHNYFADGVLVSNCHRLKSSKRVSSKRIKRYLKEYPETKFIGLSGTITKRSLHDYWHLLRWCLGDELMPLPKDWMEMAEWADAVDVKRDGSRMAPGALVRLCNEEERAMVEEGMDRAVTAARTAFQRRLVETPGVISTGDDRVACSLSIEQLTVDLSHLHPYFDRLRNSWETPDGQPFTEAVELWRHARELACGMWYKWVPAAPPEWMRARRAWCAYVRSVLAHSRRYDSELQVAQALSKGEIRDQGEHEAWARIRHTFKPNSVAQWVDDTVLKVAAKWLEDEKGLCWVEHVAVGERLAQMTGKPYYGRGGMDKAGRSIEDIDSNGKPRENGPCILSIAANGEGRNLQRYNKNLIVSFPPNGATTEQLCGRTHRSGQEADEVTVEVILGCREQWQGFQRAVQDAKYIQETTGQSQKLLYADVTVMDAQTAAMMTGALWQ